jgi:hypothetical protein
VYRSEGEAEDRIIVGDLDANADIVAWKRGTVSDGENVLATGLHRQADQKDRGKQSLNRVHESFSSCATTGD